MRPGKLLVIIIFGVTVLALLPVSPAAAAPPQPRVTFTDDCEATVVLLANVAPRSGDEARFSLTVGGSEATHLVPAGGSDSERYMMLLGPITIRSGDRVWRHTWTPYGLGCPTPDSHSGAVETVTERPMAVSGQDGPNWWLLLAATALATLAGSALLVGLVLARRS